LPFGLLNSFARVYEDLNYIILMEFFVILQEMGLGISSAGITNVDLPQIGNEALIRI
jgi:hypothetical protein